MKSKKIHWSRLNNLIIRGLFSIAALASILILVPVIAHALTPVTVAWDANNPVPDGYILYWGTTSGNYPNSHDVGAATQYRFDWGDGQISGWGNSTQSHSWSNTGNFCVRARAIDGHGSTSGWSNCGTINIVVDDQNGNGIPDSQEVAGDLDLDNDGVMDSEQADIKCVNSETDDVQIGISVKDSENGASIVSMEIEGADQTITNDESIERPESIQFGLIDFKIIVHAPGDETVVAIHLYSPAMEDGFLLKYDPINAQWLDYSDFAEFSPDRLVVYLSLQDGGFGDADGIENGIIVDPLTIGTAIGGGGSGGSLASAAGEVVEGIMPWTSCFIATAVQQEGEGRWSLWSEIRGRELAILFAIIFLGYIGRLVLNRLRDRDYTWQQSINAFLA